jgi:hypothetical protein
MALLMKLPHQLPCLLFFLLLLFENRPQILPPNSLSLAYEDTKLSDAIGPQKIVDHFCNQTVDAVMGMAYVFALAPVARMSQFWGVGGVPFFTTTVQKKYINSLENIGVAKLIA